MLLYVSTISQSSTRARNKRYLILSEAIQRLATCSSQLAARSSQNSQLPKALTPPAKAKMGTMPGRTITRVLTAGGVHSFGCHTIKIIYSTCHNISIGINS